VVVTPLDVGGADGGTVLDSGGVADVVGGEDCGAAGGGSGGGAAAGSVVDAGVVGDPGAGGSGMVTAGDGAGNGRGWIRGMLGVYPDGLPEPAIPMPINEVYVGAVEASVRTSEAKSATPAARTGPPVQYRCTRSSVSVRVSGTMWIGVPTQDASRMYGRPPKVPK
jgi:hypothetical protein